MKQNYRKRSRNKQNINQEGFLFVVGPVCLFILTVCFKFFHGFQLTDKLFEDRHGGWTGGTVHFSCTSSCMNFPRALVKLPRIPLYNLIYDQTRSFHHPFDLASTNKDAKP